MCKVPLDLIGAESVDLHRHLGIAVRERAHVLLPGIRTGRQGRRSRVTEPGAQRRKVLAHLRGPFTVLHCQNLPGVVHARRTNRWQLVLDHRHHVRLRSQNRIG